MSKDAQTPQYTGTESTQYSETLNYVKKSLTLQYVQQQIQSPAKAPVQSSGEQSGAGSGQSDSTSNK